MDELHSFIFDGLPVRGMLVRLVGGWREVLARRPGAAEFPAPVRSLMGEMAAAAVLMRANVAFDGTLVLQIFGDGPVKLAVAEARADLGFRATATVIGDVSPESRLEAMVNVHGEGRCAITLDPKNRAATQPAYQGVVALHGDRREPLQQLSAVLEHYMLQSEQLDTRLVLAANDDIAAGLLIQRLPTEGAGNLGATPWKAGNEDEIGLSEAFNRIAHLAATLQRDELLTLDAETVLRRLFWEEKLLRFAPLESAPKPHFACTCSRERVARMLEGLGRDEIDGVIEEQGRVEIACEFCGLKYHFDAVDVGELFTPRRDQPPGSSAVN